MLTELTHWYQEMYNILFGFRDVQKQIFTKTIAQFIEFKSAGLKLSNGTLVYHIFRFLYGTLPNKIQNNLIKLATPTDITFRLR